jgi:polysaccharide export outer membrane protein
MRRLAKTTTRSLAALVVISGMLGASMSSVCAQTRIAPGDKIQLTVYNHPDLSTEMIVTGAGDVRVPVAGDVAVEGLSQAAATSRVQRALSPFLYQPSIDMRVLTQGQSIFFTGSLVGVQAYLPGETLGAAIGAFRQTASTPQNGQSVTPTSFNSIDLRTVRVKRDAQTMPPLDLEALARSGDSGPRLEPGDIVLLNAKPVRVDVRGNLASPSIVYVYRGDTLAQAVAQVGPLTPATSLTAIVLHRDGVDTIVSSAGGAFTAPAHDGDIITLQPAPRVSVLGMVEKAGDTTLQASPTLLNALYEAGGPNRWADLGHVKVTHEGTSRVYDVSKLTHGDLSQNAPVADGDVIFVPEGHKIDLGAFATAIGALTSLKFLSGI